MSEEQEQPRESAAVKVVVLTDDWPGRPRGAIVSVEARRADELQRSGAARIARSDDLALAFPNFIGD